MVIEPRRDFDKLLLNFCDWFTIWLMQFYPTPVRGWHRVWFQCLAKGNGVVFHIWWHLQTVSQDIIKQCDILFKRSSGLINWAEGGISTLCDQTDTDHCALVSLPCRVSGDGCWLMARRAQSSAHPSVCPAEPWHTASPGHNPTTAAPSLPFSELISLLGKGRSELQPSGVCSIFGIGLSTFTLNQKPCTAEPKKCKQSKPLISTRKCFLNPVQETGRLTTCGCSAWKSSSAASLTSSLNPQEQHREWDAGAGETGCLSNK